MNHYVKRSNSKRSFLSSGMNPSPTQRQRRQSHPSAPSPSTLFYCAVVRRKGIELQPATKPGLSLLFYFVKANETQRKGKLDFTPFLLKYSSGEAGLGGRLSFRGSCSLLSPRWSVGGRGIQVMNKVEWRFLNYQGIC